MTEIQVPRAFRELYEPHGTYRYRGYYGGRGGGKSHAIAQALIIKASEQKLRVLCCREIQKSMRDSVHRLLKDKISKSGLSSQFDVTDFEIRNTATGSLFVFAGLRTNPDTVKSMEGIDIAWVEEAASVSQTSIDILVPTIRKAKSEIWFSWNPDSKTDPVDVLLRGDNPPPRSLIRCVNYADNPFFQPELREAMEWDRRRDPDKYAHVWLGEYASRSESRVFKNWRIEDFETPEDARFYFGADWGFSVDPTVLVRCWIDGRTLYVDQEAYRVGCEIDQTPAMFQAIDGSRKWPIRADSARPETISYMNRNGFRIVPAIKGAGSVEDGIEFLRSYDVVVHPRCRHTSDELTKYSYKVDPHTNEVLPVLADKDNHVIDALRYAVEELRRAPSLNISSTVLQRSAMQMRR